MYEVSPERGCDTSAERTVAAGALHGALEVAGVAFGDDGAELGVHVCRLSFVGTVDLRMN
jgi:hypothetical protein